MMCNPCQQLRRHLRYWFFPESQLVDQRTAEIDHQRDARKRQINETRQIVHQATQPDTLRNLAMAMTADRRIGGDTQ